VLEEHVTGVNPRTAKRRCSARCQIARRAGELKPGSDARHQALSTYTSCAATRRLATCRPAKRAVLLKPLRSGKSSPNYGARLMVKLGERGEGSRRLLRRGPRHRKRGAAGRNDFFLFLQQPISTTTAPRGSYGGAEITRSTYPSGLVERFLERRGRQEMRAEN